LVVFTMLTIFFESRTIRGEGNSPEKTLPGLRRKATVIRDTSGTPHLTASSERDAYFVMGYVHAQDRFFQMDVLRRQGSGSLAELVGTGPNDMFLGSDINMRLFGVARAAERSLNAYSEATRALIQAYSDGVNAWLDHNSLPPEYAALEINRVKMWEPLDSIIIVKLIQFQLSFDPSDIERTIALSDYQREGARWGFDGVKLFFEDLFTFAPFDSTVTIPTEEGGEAFSRSAPRSLNTQAQMLENARRTEEIIHPDALEGARRFLSQYNQNPLLNRSHLGIGSNWWALSGAKTSTGHAMLANDPHLGLGIPSIFHEIHINVTAQSSPINVYGVSYPGVPGVALGQNEYISWGVTTASLDMTDIYAERIISDNGKAVGTLFKGIIEPINAIPEKYYANQVQNGVVDDVVMINPGQRPNGLIVPSETLVSPRRNNGGIVLSSPSGGISIQFTGASATQDLEGIFGLARSRNLADFQRSIKYLGGTPLNWAYADINGNIAMYVNGTVPLREDLQAGAVDGLPPFFMRDGSGELNNEWVSESSDQSGNKYVFLPFEDMPQAVNPAKGYLVNANNDPIGLTLDNDLLNQTGRSGIYYISSGFGPGLRASKITSMIESQLKNSRCGRCGGKMSFEDMKDIQGNNQLPDAEAFVPHIIQAFNSASRSRVPPELAALAKDSALREAVKRLSEWDFSSPTGVSEGYDAGDRNRVSMGPSNQEVADSVAATIYTVWRSQIVANTIIRVMQKFGLGGRLPQNDRLLTDVKNLLDNFSVNQGVGASGIDFFEIPGITASPQIRRDIIILKSLKNALDLMAGPAFAPAFGGSTNQNDYRWGKLHRITFNHFFGGEAPQFSVPPAGGYVDLAPTLPGLAVDGGWETIDNAPFNLLGASAQAYTFGSGPARRYVTVMRSGSIKSVQVLPGGESGVVGDRFYADQLSLWLVNKYHDVLFSKDEIRNNAFSKNVYHPAK
jgi:penicillin G amidase